MLKYAGHALAIAGEHEHGERVLRRALELNRYDDGAHGYLGWVLAPSTDAGHLAEARATFDRLLAGTRKHPGRPFWFLHRAVALTCAGDFEGALAAARVAVNFGPNLTLGWLHAANALGQLGPDGLVGAGDGRLGVVDRDHLEAPGRRERPRDRCPHEARVVHDENADALRLAFPGHASSPSRRAAIDLTT